MRSEGLGSGTGSLRRATRRVLAVWAWRTSYWRLARLLESYLEQTFRPYVMHVRMAGIGFDFIVANRVAEAMYDLIGGYEDELEFLRTKVVRADDVVIECGGHHGFTALFLSWCVGPGGRIITMEPVPENANIIRRNLELNRAANVTVIQAAAGPRQGRIRIGLGTNPSVENHEADALDVTVTTLDTFAHLKPKVLKIDVEGYEVEVLKGANEILETAPALAIEIHEPQYLAKYNGSADDVLKLLDTSRYESWIKRSGEKPRLLKLDEKVEGRVHLWAIPRRAN